MFDQHLGAGHRVLQANDVASNPDDCALSYAVAVGNLIENDLFYAPKSRLGLAVFLRGTGMVFHREVLQTFPWKAHSIVEDVEYSLNFFRNGIRIRYVDEVRVRSESPIHHDQLNVQRTRWARGNLSLGKKYALRLIWEALIMRNALLADAGWTLLVLSRPLVLCELLIAAVLTVLCFIFSPGLLSDVLLVTVLAITAVQGLYFGLGIVLLGLNARRLRFLLRSPVVILHLIWISLVAAFGTEKDVWARTPR
ncbi:MAG: glycosyltransferase [Bacteroidota bacterium]